MLTFARQAIGNLECSWSGGIGGGRGGPGGGQGRESKQAGWIRPDSFQGSRSGGGGQGSRDWAGWWEVGGGGRGTGKGGSGVQRLVWLVGGLAAPRQPNSFESLKRKNLVEFWSG